MPATGSGTTFIQVRPVEVTLLPDDALLTALLSMDQDRVRTNFDARDERITYFGGQTCEDAGRILAGEVWRRGLLRQFVEMTT